jgi:hypothetical protein
MAANNRSKKHLDVEIQVRHFVREPLQFVRVEVGVVENDVVVGEGRHSISPGLPTQQVEVVSATRVPMNSTFIDFWRKIQTSLGG